MAGILKLPEELRLEILCWLGWNYDNLFSLYNTSTTLRASVVSYLLERYPRHLVSWAADTGASKLLERVVARYPEATINGSSRMKLYGICPPDALVIAARKGHAKVVEIILTLETAHMAGCALREAANEAHADVVSVMLKNFQGHHSPGFHDALFEAIQRGHTEVIKEFRKYHDQNCYSCREDLNLTARKGKSGKKGKKGKKGKNFQSA